MPNFTAIADLLGADVENPGVLAPIVNKLFKYENTLISSNIAVTGPEVDELFTGGAQIQSLHFIDKVDTSAYNHSTDNFAQKGATGSLSASHYMALRQDLNWGWAAGDLVRIITKYNPTQGATAAIPAFWSEVAEKIAVSAVKGAIASDAGFTIGDGIDELNLELMIDGETDMASDAVAIALSRKSLGKLKKSNINDFKDKSETNLGFSTYAGRALLVTEAFGDDASVLIGAGALVFGNGNVPNQIAFEFERDASAANGGGGEIVRTRQSVVAQVQGMSYKGDVRPNLAALATGTNWEAVLETGLIGVRKIRHTA